jgi:hypothetical protein
MTRIYETEQSAPRRPNVPEAKIPSRDQKSGSTVEHRTSMLEAEQAPESVPTQIILRQSYRFHSTGHRGYKGGERFQS